MEPSNVLVALAALALLLAVVVAEKAWHETIRLDGLKYMKLAEGPHFAIPDAQCSGYIDLAVPPFNNRMCSGVAPATMRVRARSQHAAPAITLKERMRVIKVTRSHCNGTAYVYLHYACTNEQSDAVPFRWLTAGKTLWKRASNYFSSLSSSGLDKHNS